MVRVLQLDSSTNTAVDGTCMYLVGYRIINHNNFPVMVHLMCRSMATTAKQDLEAVARLLYNLQDDTSNNMEWRAVLIKH